MTEFPNDLCPDRPAVSIDPDVFYRNPAFAAAFLGFCDGKLGRPAKPTVVARGDYLREYMVGARSRSTGERTS